MSARSTIETNQRERWLDQHLDLDDVAHEVLVDRPDAGAAVRLDGHEALAGVGSCSASRTGLVEVPKRVARSATFQPLVRPGVAEMIQSRSRS